MVRHGDGFEREWVQDSVHGCFAKCLQRWSLDRIAISSAAGELTFRDLDRLSDLVAHAIVSRRGVRAEPVALLLDHDAFVPAAMLGVLKAGKFYVTLDPAYPADRNRYVLADARADLVVTNEKNLALAASLGLHASSILNLDELQSAEPREYQRPTIAPDALAYVLYTSGSTGRPKGVMRTHHGLLHNVMRGTRGRGVRADDRVALLFSYSFSAAMGNTFTALLNGATLLPFNLRASGVTPLADWLVERDITVFHTVPTVFRHVAETLDGSRRFPAIRLIQLGGEPTFARDVQLFKRHFGEHAQLLVGMGTTETGHLFEIALDRHTECPADRLPVGYPVDDVDVALLDAKGQPVGVGQVGEIVVKGSFVSPGYWGRPELTAEKFRPATDDGSERTYLTGDLAYRTADGCVFHFGRNDTRVRVRGQSVEIPEVEAALLTLPGIREAVVVATADPTGDVCLAGFVVPNASTKRSGAQLRRAAGDKLPAYMVPSRFVVLEALPLLPNGKVDREALTECRAAPLDDSAAVPPRNPTEEKLVRIWTDLLRVEVGVCDNFFDVGGHSLLAMRLLTRIERTFRRRLPPATLLQAPTIEQLARVLGERAEATHRPSSLVPLQGDGSRPPFFWVHGENSNAHLGRLLGDNQPVYALLEQGRDGRRARYTSAEEIAAYYVREIRRVQSSGPYLLGGFCFGGILAFEMARQLRQDGEDVGLLVMVDPYFRWSSRPPADANWQNRMRRHGQSLAPVTTLERIGHLWRSTRGRLSTMATVFRGSIAHVLANLGVPLHPSLRLHYWERLHSQAKRAYVPRVYAGRAVVLQTAGAFDPLAEWGPLVEGGLEVHTVPGQHVLLVNDEEQIRGLATHIRKHLDRAFAGLA